MKAERVWIWIGGLVVFASVFSLLIGFLLALMVT